MPPCVLYRSQKRNILIYIFLLYYCFNVSQQYCRFALEFSFLQSVIHFRHHGRSLHLFSFEVVVVAVVAASVCLVSKICLVSNACAAVSMLLLLHPPHHHWPTTPWQLSPRSGLSFSTQALSILELFLRPILLFQSILINLYC